MDQWAKHFSSLPMGASARDQSTSMDELGRKVYRSPTGQQYTFPMEGEGGQRGSVVRAAAEDPTGALSSIISALVGGLGSAISAPGRAAMGQPVTNGDVWSTGGMAQLAAMPMQAPDGALRSGAMGSTRAADEVLGMLKAGKASKITDKMMDAADPQYLYQNYDLPMDAASRMARAQDMGFNTPAYHGTAADVKSFKKVNRGAHYPDRTFSTPDQGYAGSYASTAPEIAPGNDAWRAKNAADAGPNVMPLRLRDFRDSSEIANEYVSYDPTQLRSQFARFDPRLSHLKNLSAAAAPVAMGSLAAMPQSDKEEIRKYLGMIY